MRRFAWIVLSAALLGALVVPGFAGRAVAAPVQSSHAAAVNHESAHFFDKTRFLLHMGLAYYAFHHWVISPWKAGSFKTGASHRVTAIVKAGLATLFAYHEVSVSYGIAKKSNSATLHAIIAPLGALQGLANKVGNELKKGNYNTADVNGLVNNVNSFGGKAAKNGLSIKDIVYKIPGL